MSDTIRGFQNFRIYLLPALLLVIAGALLMAVLYYPTPATIAVVESRTAGPAEQGNWQAHAETQFVAMVVDALRELRTEQETQARTLMYRHQQNPFSAEQPVMLQIAPPVGENVRGDSARSSLIQL